MRQVSVPNDLQMNGGMNRRTRGRLRMARSQTSKTDGWRSTFPRGWTVEARSLSSLAARAITINY